MTPEREQRLREADARILEAEKRYLRALERLCQLQEQAAREGRVSTTTHRFKLPSGRFLQYGITPPLGPTSSDPEAPLVVLANPLCTPFTVWEHVIAKLASRGFRVLTYNQSGHGDSSSPKDLSATTFDWLADDARFLLRHLNRKQVHAWVGVSMGAATGIVFAAKYPGVIGRLVACDTVSCSPVNAGNPDIFAPRVEIARRDGIASIVDGTLERWFGRHWLAANPTEASRLRAAMCTTRVDGFETCCAALASPSFDLRRLAQRAGRGVRDGAMLLVGENDADLPQTMEELRRNIEVGVRQMQGANALVELRVIENAGHVCFIDGFDQFCENVLDFLED